MKNYTEANEYSECLALVAYLRLLNIRFTHIHNEMFTRSWSQKSKAKMLGVTSGIPDYLCIVKNKLIFIEMKKEKGGQVSDTQKEWIAALNECVGVQAVICRGFYEAKNIIDQSLKN